jgi:hypothetical protein
MRMTMIAQPMPSMTRLLLIKRKPFRKRKMMGTNKIEPMIIQYCGFMPEDKEIQSTTPQPFIYPLTNLSRVGWQTPRADFCAYFA